MKNLILISLLILTFFFGAYTSTVLNSISFQNNEVPYVNFVVRAQEKSSPGDIIKVDQIERYPDRVIIYVNNPHISRYSDTNSMDPLLDETTNGIEIIPVCSNLQVGDIIAYNPVWTSDLIVHRIIDKNVDSKGVFFTTKGDNSFITDPQKVRCDQIKYQLIGILY